jgi:hypothetical protein
METVKTGGRHMWFSVCCSLYRLRIGYNLYIQENSDLMESKSYKLQWWTNGIMSVETVVRYADCLVLNWNFANVLKQGTVTYCTEFFRFLFLHCLCLAISYLIKHKSEFTFDSRISPVVLSLFISLRGVAAITKRSANGTELIVLFRSHESSPTFTLPEDQAL